ncbi:MAG: ribosomal protein S18-alanine N-acetyltransferase [Deltaproteobacteria bacterium]|nr:ribosomal protein S18-alanine N-acetyltransferase [Candidatus Anaeroferrophillus wilburensis]MBN2888283.1 ribosomal protein S18-alanine N-acetyltransferase [Deltaproteobacteria bacterium]
MAVAEQEILPFSLLPATGDHLSSIMAIDQQSFPDPWGRRLFLDELTAPHSRLYCALQKQWNGSIAVCGYICFHCCLDEASLLKIAVHPEKRRQGFASALLQKMMASAAGEGVRTIHLEVRPSNTAAVRLYQSFGFSCQGKRRHYFADTGEDALIMSFYTRLQNGEPGEEVPL